MIDSLWCYNHGRRGSLMKLESVFAWGLRFQILTDTQEEKDYLTGMQLMFGREIDIQTWEEWNHRRKTVYIRSSYAKPFEAVAMQPPLLPFYFCTSEQEPS